MDPANEISFTPRATSPALPTPKSDQRIGEMT
jgi:hypothetical protein